MSQIKPLVLDVDGTLLKTDLADETFWAGLRRAPLAVIAAVFAHGGRVAARRHALAHIAEMRTDLLPVNPQVAEIAEAALQGGTPLALSSSADEASLRRLAEANGLDGPLFASDGARELRGAAKAQALIAAFGRDGFHYAGKSPADRPVWEAADGCILVGAHSALAEDLKQQGKEVTELPSRWRIFDLLRALRPHHWAKNSLLLVPILAAHLFELTVLAQVGLAFLAFSAAASAIYLINDLLDLEADRLHPAKRRRPFASGAVPIRIGEVLALLLGLAAMVGAAVIGWKFFAVLAIYMVLSLAYSLKLKRMRWTDLFALSALYCLRVIAGAAAAGIAVSGYLIAWIFPVFLTLAVVKRLTELSTATSDDPVPGRGYRRADREDLYNIGVLGIVWALLVFLAYSFSPQALLFYPLQWLLWVAMLPMALWLGRMLRLGWRGTEEHDPLLFALKDLLGIGLILLTLSLMFYAAGIWQDLFGL